MSASSSQSSGVIAVTAGQVLWTGQCLLNGIQITTDGTNAVTVTVYDNTAASGKIVAQAAVAGATLSGSRNFIPQIRTEIGLTVVVAGTGGSAIIMFGGKTG